MLENLYHFNRKELSFFSLVYKKVNLWSRMLTLLVLLSGVVCMGWYMSSQRIYLIITGFGLIAIAVTLNHFFIALTVRRHYPQHYISRFSWSVAGFHKDAVAKLGRYLRQEDIDQSKAGIMQELLKEKAARERTNSIVFISCFAALFIPLWTTYLDHLFGAIKDIEVIGKLFMVLSTGIVFLSLLMMNLGDFRDNIFTRFMKLNKLSDLICEVYLVSDIGQDQSILLMD